jgi:hypothetical protein
MQTPDSNLEFLTEKPDGIRVSVQVLHRAIKICASPEDVKVMITIVRYLQNKKPAHLPIGTATRFHKSLIPGFKDNEGSTENALPDFE